MTTSDTSLRWLWIVLTAVGVAVMLGGVADVVVHRSKDAPIGWYLAPVGGLVAMVGLGMLARRPRWTADPFTDEEIEELRRRQREGDDG